MVLSELNLTSRKEVKINNKKYIFGPVPSRRLGVSLGIDLIPFKTCSLDCLYCECGKTNNFTLKREAFVSAETIIEELKPYLDKNKIDHITFSGAGEPTLNSEIGKIINKIKDLTDIPVAVLTNSTLFTKNEVRKDLLNADIILPSLDAVSKDIFTKINRPLDGVDINKIIDGLIKFRYEFSGKIWLEIFIVNGINDSDKELLKIYKTILKINPDKVQLNTLDRPPAFKNIISADMDLLLRLKTEWNLLPVEIIKRVGKRSEILSYSKNLENNILNLIMHSPINIEELIKLTGKNKEELYKYIDILIKEKKIMEKVLWGKIFLIKNKGGKYVKKND